MSLSLEFYPADEPERVLRLVSVLTILSATYYGQEALKMLKGLKDRKGVLTAQWWESPDEDMKFAVEQTWRLFQESTVEHIAPRRFVGMTWDV
jgi:hypothetical protein